LLGSSLLAYWGVWASTLAAMVVVWIGGEPMRSLTRHALGLRLQPAHTPAVQLGHVLALAAHNIPIASWPLLLGLAGVDRHLLTRRLADCVVVMCLLANTAPVGAALGAYGSALIAYVPQLPLEWAGIALGAGAWLVQRRGALGSRELLVWFALIAAVLLCAATLETTAVPHR
jgi:hypothetical protein